VSWLETIGLNDFLRSFPLPKLVEWQWITPVARIHVDQSFFDGLEQLRSHQTSRPATELEILWQPIWSIDDSESINWCIDPLSIPGSSLHKLLNASHNCTTKPPNPYIDENKSERYPYVDHYLHWQGYALIDTIMLGDNGPLIRTPDVAERLARLVPWIADSPPTDARSIAYSAARWGGERATHFTWISHYRSTRSALAWYARRVPQDDQREFLARGALTLSQFLGIGPQDLHVALKNSLLVVAQEWRSRRETSNGFWVSKAWKELQKDVYDCVEWLCLLEKKWLNEYLEQYNHEFLSDFEWARLHEIIDFGHFKSLLFFSKHARRYIEKALPNLKNKILEEPIKVRSLAYKIIELCPPFEDFIEAFNAIHDDLRSRNEENQLDLRNRRPVDHIATLALRAETCLRYVIMECKPEKLRASEKIDSLPKYISHILLQNNNNNLVRSIFNQKDVRDMTSMRNNRETKVRNLIAVHFSNLTDEQQSFIKALLGCEIARNYFAHHYDLDGDIVRGDIGQFIIASTIFTVWHLLIEYLEIT
jgi:hypothetical protein